MQGCFCDSSLCRAHGAPSGEQRKLELPQAPGLAVLCCAVLCCAVLCWTALRCTHRHSVALALLAHAAHHIDNEDSLGGGPCLQTLQEGAPQPGARQPRPAAAPRRARTPALLPIAH